jgi:hypothetical protein
MNLIKRAVSGTVDSSSKRDFDYKDEKYRAKNDIQERAVNLLRTKIGDLNLNTSGISNDELIRFLIARNFNVEKSLKLWINAYKFKEKLLGNKDLLNFEDDCKTMLAFHMEGLCYYSGKSIENDPVLIIKPRMFLPKLLDIDNVDATEALGLFITCYIDKVLEIFKKDDRLEIVCICDLKGFSMNNFNFALLKFVITLLQDLYPERLRIFACVNAPIAFTMSYRIISPLLNERTRSKVKIYKNNQIHLVSKDQLEVDFGGTHSNYSYPDKIVQSILDDFLTSRTAGSGTSSPTMFGAANPSPSAKVRKFFQNVKTSADIRIKRNRKLSIVDDNDEDIYGEEVENSDSTTSEEDSLTNSPKRFKLGKPVPKIKLKKLKLKSPSVSMLKRSNDEIELNHMLAKLDFKLDNLTRHHDDFIVTAEKQIEDLTNSIQFLKLKLYIAIGVIGVLVMMEIVPILELF